MSKRSAAIREASGNVTNDDPLVTFLYLLARDQLPIGKIDRIIGEVMDNDEQVAFTNGWLAKWAKYSAEQIRENSG